MTAAEGAPIDHVHLDLKSTFKNIEKVVERMRTFATGYLEDEESAYRAILATSEAVTNAIQHGNSFDDSKSVIVDFCAYADRLEVSVEDEGEGFDRMDVKNPLDEENLLQSHGRGIYLIETLADEVTYELGGRRVRMTFRRT